jgi:preprotein translocase subunit SecD
MPEPLQGFPPVHDSGFHAKITENKEAMMKTGLISMFIAGLLGGGIGVTYAADTIAEKEASPTIKERLTKDTIKGTLMNIEGEFYSIKDNDGKQYRIHVDKSTKLDKVVVGDMVKAYVTDQGHTTTLQRDN